MLVLLPTDVGEAALSAELSALSNSKASASRLTYSTDPGPKAGVGFVYGLTTATGMPAGIIACRSDCGGTGWKDIYCTVRIIAVEFTTQPNRLTVSFIFLYPTRNVLVLSSSS